MATLPRSSLADVVQQPAIPLPERVTIGLAVVVETAREGCWCSRSESGWPWSRRSSKGR